MNKIKEEKRKSNRKGAYMSKLLCTAPPNFCKFRTVGLPWKTISVRTVIIASFPVISLCWSKWIRSGRLWSVICVMSAAVHVPKFVKVLFDRVLNGNSCNVTKSLRSRNSVLGQGATALINGTRQSVFGVKIEKINEKTKESPSWNGPGNTDTQNLCADAISKAHKQVMMIAAIQKATVSLKYITKAWRCFHTSSRKYKVRIMIR